MILAPAFRYQRNGWSFGAAGTYAGYGQGAWSADGTVSGSYFSPSTRAIRPEISATASSTAGAFGASTDELGLQGRLHHIGRGGGIWAGGSIFRSSTGTATLDGVGATLGVWRSSGPATVAITAEPEWASDGSAYADYSASAQVFLRRIQFQARATLRNWISMGAGHTEAGITAAAEVPLTADLAIVVGGGSYLGNVSQALPAGRFLTIGVRLGGGPSLPPRPPATTIDDHLVPRLGATLTVAGTVEGLREISVRSPGAVRVEVEGDFTDWRPVALDPDGRGNWRGKFPILPGVHRLNVRVDGGEWGAPAGIPAEADEFGVTSGVLVVE